MAISIPRNLDELLAQPQLLGITALLGGILILLLLKASSSGSMPAKAAGKKKAAKERPQRGYTRAEVAKHTAEDDLWLIIKNKGHDQYKVYDVTEYIWEHPGGAAIFDHAGADATQGFLGIQHPPTVYDLVEEYCIGWLEDE